MMMLEELNRSLFLSINGPADPGVAVLVFARLCAVDLMLAVPLYLVVAWLRGGEGRRVILLEAALVCALGFLISAALGMLWMHPRPFMVPLGHTLMAHAPDSSFPSDHLTGIWSVAFSLLWHPKVRRAGMALALLGLPVAWARIYLGVHFPLDMVGAALVAVASVAVFHVVLPGAAGLLLPGVNAAYRWVFAPLIRRGWVAY
ncbi:MULTISPECIES: phosphatase PAP2 family protein [unclassified Comamonas]|uniref:phosphatase PAP2 family protein n=1 Tax=unclassified Comamonas TaxID=2638500 RepID=UPI0025C5BE8A|nr:MULTISPECIES: phosphatase PAP2 family protein [unclassified Comamonas]